MKKCIILLSGSIDTENPFYSEIIKGADIFCADGGANHLFKLGGIPKLILGDLDSITPSVLEFYTDKGVNFIKFPCHKNETDGELIIREVEKLNYDEVLVLGALGGRTDHFLTNINLLSKFKNIKLVSEHEEIFFIHKNHFLHNKSGLEISFIPLSDVVISLSLKGFEYTLENFHLERGSSRCTSNRVASEKALISYDEGILIGIINKY